MDNASFIEWPTAGLDVVATNVTERYKPTFSMYVALLEDATNFVPFYQSQSGPDGRLCIARVRPWRLQGWDEEKWVGKEAMFQIVEYVGNGVKNYAVNIVQSPIC